MMMPVFMKYSPFVLDGSVTRRISFVYHLIILFFLFWWQADKYPELSGFVDRTSRLQETTRVV